MTMLIIIDSNINIPKILGSIKNYSGKIYIFSLTSNFLIIKDIQKHLKTLPHAEVSVMDSAGLIHAEVNIIKNTIHTWSYELGNQRIGKKTLKEWFILPDQSGTSWWFSLISEKNSVQDDVFFKIAQINALKKHIENNHYTTCFISLSDQRLTKIIKNVANATIPNIQQISTVGPGHKRKYKQQLFNIINKMGVLGAFFMSLICWIIWLRDSRFARQNLPPLKQRLQKSSSFLFISYFPNIDEEAAKNGIFRNKYSLALQEKLAELSTPITWLLMPVFYNGHNYPSSIRLAKNFCEQEERLFVLQEFFTIKIFFKSIMWWLKQSFLSSILLFLIPKEKLVGKLTNLASQPMLKYLWWHSFIGTSGTRGIIFYLTYLEMFKTLPYVKNCLYYSEMQAWEKAMILAKKQASPNTHTIAFQHTIVTTGFFHYFYDARETQSKKSVLDMPLPDKLLANGKLTYSLLSQSKYPNLSQVEAIRQLYLHHFYQKRSLTTLASGDKPIIFVAGSYDKIETKSFITMIYSAFPQPKNFDIYFKGSPINPLEPLFEELGIDPIKCNYQILYSDVSEILMLASIALIANTTVALEALAFGCELIIPILADTMLMNPVLDTSANYFLANHPDQLKLLVETLINKNQKKDIDNADSFIKNYWNIDPHLPMWTKLLTACINN